MVDHYELRRQMLEGFSGTDYPISTPMDLVPALPDGPGTTFESGDFSMTMIELNTKLPSGDFPYDSPEQFVDDILHNLADEGYIPSLPDDLRNPKSGSGGRGRTRGKTAQSETTESGVAYHEIRRQMLEAFSGADYPISSPMDLVPALPDGPGTTFESGDFSMTSMELNTKLPSGDFPYDSPEQFVDDVLENLVEEGYISQEPKTEERKEESSHSWGGNERATIDREDERAGRAENSSMSYEYDVFVCHAGEDKPVVRPLARELDRMGADVWYDEFELQIGDSLRNSIDRGLAKSRYGVVVISEAFFGKNWPERELEGLTSREMREGTKVLLPLWHGIDQETVVSYSPPLADRVAEQIHEDNVVEVAEQLYRIIES